MPRSIVHIKGKLKRIVPPVLTSQTIGDNTLFFRRKLTRKEMNFAQKLTNRLFRKLNKMNMHY